ncbi:MAG: DUF2283 domain-containing protein [Chloroflexi bacterium]|nr:DUF2283 domain-containing protein [Chloroflexota bacterium]MBI3733684.1 DUF2283 domain-containing protein [Chloroflexota bacterium]
MKATYDREQDILLIEVLPEAVIDHAEQSGSLISHFSPEDQLVLLETLDASQFLSSLMQVAIRGGEQALSPAA